MIVGWPDTGLVGSGVVHYLRMKLAARLLLQVEPLGFYPLDGVQVKDNVVEFAQNNLFFCKSGGKELLIFDGNRPAFKTHQLLDLLLGMAEKYRVRRIYTVGGLYSRIPHTRIPRIMAVFNQAKLRKEVTKYNLLPGLDYEGPPSINGFLLWLARNRDLEGISLWGEVPFYISGMKNPKVIKSLVDSLGVMLGLEIDTSDLQKEADYLDEKLNRARQRSPDIENSLQKLENQAGITEEELRIFMQRLNEFI